MLPPDDAWNRIAERCFPLPEETLPRRAAAGRVLTRTLAAAVDAPAHDVSAMDGYALPGPVPPGEPRPVAATIAAGDPPGYELAAPAVARIMTGAPIPRGADRVVPVEASEAGGRGRQEVVFRAQAGPGDHIRRRGEVVRAGDPLLPAGALLTPGALSLLAAHGYAEVPVHRAPTVAVLTTGDEVVPPETVPAPGQLRDSHTDFLLAAGAALGLPFRSLGIAPDDAGEIARRAAEGLRSDVLLLCGGVSMGEFDLAEGVLASLGCEAHFDAVAMQPGKPLVFATRPPERGGGIVFGLPGNPASVMVSYWLFVRPALRRLLGMEAGWWHGALAGRLAAPLPGAAGRDRFLPAEVAVRGGEAHVTPLVSRGSHDLAAYGRGIALVRVRAGAAPAAVGAPCEILPLDA